MSKHTPGRWDINYEPNLKQIEVFQPNKVGGRFQGVQIAVLRNAAPAREAQVEANARLIAAAPELLEALKNIENDDGRIPKPIWKKRCAAIAKAEGTDE